MTETPNSRSAETFEEIGLPDRLMLGIRQLGFTKMTPIQAKALPPGLAGRDVAGQAQTGTGKTLAFLIPAFKTLLDFEPQPGMPGALVLSPTRELADQVKNDAIALGGPGGFRTTVIFGGVGYGPQKEALQNGVHLLVATPGRLLDLEESKDLSLSGLKVVIVDEADRMFDMGFIKDVRRILRKCPPKERRQTFMFSATLNYQVVELAWEQMYDFVEVRVEPPIKTPELAEQVLYHVGMEEKMPLLVGLLEREEWEQALVFVNTRWMAEEVARRLEENGHKTGLLSGAVDQGKRLQLMDQFKRKELPILVATDVASRGLHIDGISHVINYDLPQDKEEYVHRVGRTARAGKTGKVITLACEKYVEKLPEIEAFLGMKIPTARFEIGELGADKSRARHRAPFRRPPMGGRRGVARRGPPPRSGGRRR